jgi:class 3 adenylate cyclase
MRIISWVEERVGLPDDSETFRAQKVLSFGMIIGGLILTLLSALIHYLVGFTLAPLAFISLGFFLSLTGILLLWRPSLFLALAVITLCITILANFAGVVLSGGLTSGTYDIIWAFVGILGAVLIVNWRFAGLMVLIFALCVLAAVFLEPSVRAYALEAPLSARLAIGTYNLVFFGAYLAGSTLLLIRVIESLRVRADTLLLNILPAPIAARLKQNPATIADGFDEVTVLFADIVDFTSMSSAADPVEVVTLLNDIFSEFDDLAANYKLEKIKTIGDAYMVAAGLPEPRADHVEAIMGFAIDMLAAVERCQGLRGEPVRLRVGINTGPVVAGVIGRQKFIYDLWGDAVNVASRMESNGLTNQIQVTQAVKDKLEGQYIFAEREPIYVKGKGMMVTYLLKLTEAGG